jgi:hypothetical protein
LQTSQDFLVRRLAAILLIVCFVALGTRAAEFLHNQSHAREDAIAAANTPASNQPAQPRNHDENNCDIHLKLHLPLLDAAFVPLLICVGIFVAFLTLLAPPLLSQRVAIPFDSRGPPVSC